jgi:sugar phosphate permease
MAVWTILFGGIPAAILGGWLGRRTRLRSTRWSSVWSTAFLGGFVFQLSALLLAPFMFIAFASYVGDVRVMFGSPDVIAISMGLMLIALCSAIALRSWLSLRASAQGGTLYRT